MNYFKKYSVAFGIILTVSVTVIACSKGGDSTPTPAPPVVNVCAAKTLTVSAAVTNASTPCTTGSIIVTAGGSTGFMYNIDNGVFQVSNQFTSVSVGDHPITIKDADGCTKSTTATVAVASTTSGPLFASVKTIITANCVSCHAGASPSGGKNFSNDCNIVSNADRIKVRTVDGSPTFMPQGGQLSTADKKKISDWFNAGGKYSD